jgi:hypothetical protein
MDLLMDLLRSCAPLSSQVGRVSNHEKHTSSTAIKALPFVMADASSAAHLQYHFSDTEPIEMTLRSPYAKDSIGKELALEASLHVSTFQAISCEAQFAPTQSFGFPVLQQAPSLKSMEHAMSSESERISQIQSLAACLATPLEPPASPAGAAGGRTLVMQGSAGVKVQDEVQNVINRWSDWVRRIRKKRRFEAVAALISARGDKASVDDSPTRNRATIESCV